MDNYKQDFYKLCTTDFAILWSERIEKIRFLVNKRVIDTVRQYIMIIPKDFGVKKAYLFGSFAKGKEKEESDVDIALVLETMPDFFHAQKQLMKPPCQKINKQGNDYLMEVWLRRTRRCSVHVTGLIKL